MENVLPFARVARFPFKNQSVSIEHYENFPVASLLLPASERAPVAAIYRFARSADDFADEGELAPAERLARLEAYRAELRGIARGEASGEPLFAELGRVVRARGLPLEPFHDLLDAFAQDVLKPRYADFGELLEYCRRSANPVGRLVLRVAGYDVPRLEAASDAMCTALQLANFWQDFGRDWRHGRLYVPLEEYDRQGAREADLDAGQMTAAWRRTLAAAVGRTRRLFDAGRPVCDGVAGRLRWELRLTWLGGARILDRIEASGFDVLHHRPALGARDAGPLLWRAVVWTTDHTDHTD